MRQVVKETKIRIFAGITKSQEKIVSVFEPRTEIRKGKSAQITLASRLEKLYVARVFSPKK